MITKSFSGAPRKNLSQTTLRSDANSIGGSSPLVRSTSSAEWERMHKATSEKSALLAERNISCAVEVPLGNAAIDHNDSQSRLLTNLDVSNTGQEILATNAIDFSNTYHLDMEIGAIFRKDKISLTGKFILINEWMGDEIENNPTFNSQCCVQRLLRYMKNHIVSFSKLGQDECCRILIEFWTQFHLYVSTSRLAESFIGLADEELEAGPQLKWMLDMSAAVQHDEFDAMDNHIQDMVSEYWFGFAVSKDGLNLFKSFFEYYLSFKKSGIWILVFFRKIIATPNFESYISKEFLVVRDSFLAACKSVSGDDDLISSCIDILQSKQDVRSTLMELQRIESSYSTAQ